MERKNNDKAKEDKLLDRRWQRRDWCVERIGLSMVLQDCADQMAVLGHIAQCISKGLAQGNEKLHEIQSKSQVELCRVSEAAREERRVHMELRRALENKPLIPDVLLEVERDRRFLALVIKNVLEELQEADTFYSLLAAVEDEKRKKAHYHDMIWREEQSQQQIVDHQCRLCEISREYVDGVEECQQATAQLCSQLQEMHAKAIMESDYTRGISQLKVQQGQEHNVHQENMLGAVLHALQDRLAEERFIHAEMEYFLVTQLMKKEKRLERWMKSSEVDLERVQMAIDVLKNTKELERLQELRVAAGEEGSQEEAPQQKPQDE
ncbi:hypothetical protein AAFF_G00343590 [Aldrovandia affinis]|uniref:Uncharacterized protein n=1 Tax=Aldrovandia affinis TaxID=143900 RepID=A0AAD7WPW9_9TELE|nr:hypothetical protein AAFF_G00343590 [Aldrovandia affinis]